MFLNINMDMDYLSIAAEGQDHYGGRNHQEVCSGGASSHGHGGGGVWWSYRLCGGDTDCLVVVVNCKLCRLNSVNISKLSKINTSQSTPEQTHKLRFTGLR